MKLVRTEDLEPDMVLARPVTNATGAVLCPQGFVLTQNVIDRFRRSGLSAVAIEAESSIDASKRLSELEQRYEGVDDALLLSLKQAAQLYFETG